MARQHRKPFPPARVRIIVAALAVAVGATAAFSALRPRENALEARLKSDFARLKRAVQTFRLEQGRWPSSLDDLLDPPPRFSGDRSPYVTRAPLDPWGAEYLLALNDRHPVILSLGPDGIEGTPDDIAASIADRHRGRS